ncbi:DEAD/DEAH box helicase [Pectobacterium polaris]|uniref:DEAD/DEAH box helicase n=1 Tax=Pectobacterium polaris TaxID=2042057 RepID=UPI0023B1BD6B|nr:DEAD/DEAH box helicase [Pectobacterium polaris]MDE8757134.1 DEAD/DEAH box helicase [Pectobacterium polaris]
MNNIEYLYFNLVEKSISNLLCKFYQGEMNELDVLKLLSYSSLLSLSNDTEDIIKSYDIISRILELHRKDNGKIVAACDLILSRIGNFPGRELLRSKYNGGLMPSLSLSLSLERLGRESENTYGDVQLTNFQYELFSSLDKSDLLSVSAPTSAGKSFVLSLSVVNKIKNNFNECIVYVVPTRALITEVSNKLRQECIRAGLHDVILRTAPDVIEKSNVSQGLIYVLTQERLLSLLSNSYNSSGFSINSLFVDEAHEIQKGKRGIVLQNAIELAIEQHPYMQVMFSSPLISNPDYFFSVFKWKYKGTHFTETISPVTQNIILINSVKNNTKALSVTLQSPMGNINLGIFELDFVFRGGKIIQKAMLAEFISKSGGAVIVYENNPSNAENIAVEISKRIEVDDLENDYLEFISLVEDEMHEKYSLLRCLSSRVAFHYGNMPSIIRNGIEYFFKRGDIEYFFKRGDIEFMVCTSTLLQGVNLPAKHLILEDPHSGDIPMNRADFLNLAGRAGRLKYEFHGNVWCVRSDTWEYKSFEGEKLQTIKSAMEKVMEDGGSIISNAIDNVFEASDDRELADVAFARFFQEVKRDNYQLSYFNTYGDSSYQELLEYNFNTVKRLSISVPDELIKLNSGTRPDYIQRLYDFFNEKDDLSEYVLMSPYSKGGKSRVDKAIEIIVPIFNWSVSHGYTKLISMLAHQWMTSRSLKSMINYKIAHSKELAEMQHSNSSESVIRKKISSLIRDVLNTLENQVRYNLVRYIKIYREVLIYVLIERNEKEIADQVENISAYLEFGSCNPTELNLMALGISRSTALYLKNKIKLPPEGSPEDFIKMLKDIDMERLGLPTFRIRELKDVLGV